ncbi:helix-turn-helix domain-containing protein [Glaciibacter psychrotolerans]|uniref:Transcriptional regulator with XRE-family HTH domain n=1 Tax=Glaciibacter psychrotolerans TaxID=670054 RepID=A0A7Z0J593_9MICO|nr:helix-turn-helix transcriptional regulator [Leifsonia psychrotolerans]NYJ19145.1 transcriptional regulator with XRE-family HTH domain [Leifsonia psychrotolerans]
MRNATVSKFPEQTSHRNNVAAAVRAHMGVRQIKDAALAREIGMTQSTMSRRTNGEMPFDVDELGRIARVFGISLVELISMPKGHPSD